MEPDLDTDENGVDLTLIRWFLDLSVEERFAQADEWRIMSEAMMEAFREQHLHEDARAPR